MHEADREILDHFVSTREKTVELARRLPDECLSLALHDWGDSVGRTLVHIAEGVDWWMHNVIGDGKGGAPAYRSDTSGVVDALSASRGRLVSFFEADEGKPMGRTYTFRDAAMGRREEEAGNAAVWVGRRWVHYITDHEIHHRGKVVLALRQSGFSDFPFFP